MNLELHTLLWLYLSQKIEVDSIPPAVGLQQPYFEQKNEIRENYIEGKVETNFQKPVAIETRELKKAIEKAIGTREEKREQERKEEEKEEEKQEQESDALLREKKKIEMLFPKPSISYPSSIEPTEQLLQSIEKQVPQLSLTRNNQLKAAISSFSPSWSPRWQVISLLHRESGQKELTNFIQSVSKAITERLKVDISTRSLQLSTGAISPIEVLSLSDSSITLFFGEEHRLSSLQKFVNGLSEFTYTATTGYMPALFLGTYFDTLCFFISIDQEKIQNRSFKQELWNLLQQLRIS